MGLLLLLALGLKLLLLVAKLGSLLELLVLDRLVLLLGNARDAIVEFLELGGAVRRLIRRRAPASSIRSIALSGRLRS